MIGSSRLPKTTTVLLTTLLASSCAPPPPEIPTPTTEELALVLSEVVFYPEVTCEELREAFDVEYLPLVETPDGIGLAYEEHWLPTAGEGSLRLWYLPTALDRGVVVLSQGSLGAMPCYLFHARMLAHNGWAVVMYEYRGFGGSDGEPDISALKGDLSAVVDWARAYTGREQVTLMGISLGAIPSVAVAVEHPEGVNGVVLDSPVAMGEMIQRMEFALRSQTQEFIDRLAPDLVPEDLVQRMHQPLLIFAGEEDQLTPPPTIQLIYDRAAGPKQIVRFPGVGHAREPFSDTGTYTYHLEAFLSSLWLQHVPLNLQTAVSEAE
jgi:pimeloyl-ACP methyl ester carboxylesterase